MRTLRRVRTARQRVDRAVRQAGPVALWFCGEDLKKFAPSATVTEWRDRARGNVASAASTPTLELGLVARPGVLINGNEEGFTFTPGLTTAGDWTVILVGALTKTPSTADAQYCLDAETGRLICMFDSVNGTSKKPAYFEGTFREGTTDSTTGDKILVWRMNNGAGLIRVNRADDTTGMSYTQVALGGTVGLFTSYVPGNSTHGYMHELIVYFGALGDGQIRNVEAALDAYYQVTF